MSNFQSTVQFIIGCTIRTALLINVFRWVQVCINKSKNEEKPERIKIYLIISHVVMFVLVAVTVAMYLINTFRLGNAFSISKIWSVYVLFSIISIAYIVIYIILRVHYRRILKKAEEKVNKKSNNINRKAIAEALKSMLIFFLAMI